MMNAESTCSQALPGNTRHTRLSLVDTNFDANSRKSRSASGTYFSNSGFGFRTLAK
jgi:hypothetical protein